MEEMRDLQATTLSRNLNCHLHSLGALKDEPPSLVGLSWRDTWHSGRTINTQTLYGRFVKIAYPHFPGAVFL